MFAKKDIERGQVVVEYMGELISLMEATEHKAEYARVEKTCTLMVITVICHHYCNWIKIALLTRNDFAPLKIACLQCYD